ncbi:MAG: nucleoside phosphorylase [Bacteroidales bacterium]|nr:nucleoside phosphorylase [Bacteroidales bacterium]
MKRYPETELILNPNGAVYHLNLKPEQIADNIILVGDPGRVKIVSDFFQSKETTVQNRELITVTGRYKGTRISVISTGMGTDNIDIVLNELDALANIDFKKRINCPEFRSLNIIRIGTSGALQEDIPLNAYIQSDYGLGLDGILYFYNKTDNIFEKDGIQRFIEMTNWPEELPKPYLVKSTDFLHLINDNVFTGITITAPGFYEPQGRTLRIGSSWPEMVDKIRSFKYENKRVLNFEMESSALFGLGQLMGHKTFTICITIANRITRQYSRNYRGKLLQLIEMVLEGFTDL